jgi:hypothetical protein
MKEIMYENKIITAKKLIKFKMLQETQITLEFFGVLHIQVRNPIYSGQVNIYGGTNCEV